MKIAMLENANKIEELKDVNQKPENHKCTVSTVSLMYIMIHVIFRINILCNITILLLHMNIFLSLLSELNVGAKWSSLNK